MSVALAAVTLKLDEYVIFNAVTGFMDLDNPLCRRFVKRSNPQNRGL